MGSCVCLDPSQASDLEWFNAVFIQPWDMNSPRKNPWVAQSSLLKAVGVEGAEFAGPWRCWDWECLGLGILLLLTCGSPISRPYR